MKELHQRPISYYPIYRKITGSTTAGILLSQLMYWWSRIDGDKFYKTDAEAMEETLLTADELRSAKTAMKGLSFIKITREGIPAKTFYEVDFNGLCEKIRSISQNKIREIPESLDGKSPQLYSIVQETTTKEPQTPEGRDIPSSATPKQKEKAKKNTPQPPSPPTVEDFAGFANPDMAMEIWAEWIEYKKVQHKKTYKLASSERTAIGELLSYSSGSIPKARSIVKRSIANTWSGLFPYDEKTAISSPIPVPDQKIPEDNYQLPEEMQARYEASTKWFYEKCHLCAGIRWLSKEEYEKIQNKDSDFIGVMWSVHCKSTEFSNVIRESLKTLNQLPRWDKEKWLSVYEWLKKDVSDRIFKEGNYEQS